MNNTFETMINIEEFIHHFEQGTLQKESWTHEAHFIIALWYLLQNPLPTVLENLPEAIKKNNIALGIPNNEERGYHKTITYFYIFSINNYIKQQNIESLSIEHFQQLLTADIINKNYPLQFYSSRLLFSIDARKNWIKPDLRSLNAPGMD
ncbi:hypothetical protein [Candidatus Uabimicrobium sp. HlEnr_7]|uniref:hypothetical protein n=1 Tax=Candidatus Uabimicrobium helgolandensis TaxID=3095367 RepID=UPI0035575DCE